MVTRNAVAHAEIHRLIGALCLEIRGFTFKARPTNMQLAKRWCGSTKRTKQGVLIDLITWFHQEGGTLTAQWSTVSRTIGQTQTTKLRKKVEDSNE